MKISMKRILSLFIILTVIFSMVGCGNSSIKTNKKAETSSKTNTQSEYVEELKIGTTKSNDSFTTMMEGGSFGKMNYNSFCAAPFIERDAKGEIQPYIMESWESSDDQMTLVATFATDKDIKWHDGEPLVMDDIIFTFDYMLNVRKASYINQLDHIEKIDEKTVKFHFKEPAAFTFLNTMATFFYVQPKHIWEDVEDPKTYMEENAVIGCGPYKFTGFDEDAQTIYYEAVDNYFKGDLTVKKVSVRTYESHDSLVMALKKGEVDAMFDYSNSLNSSMAPSIIDVENLDPGKSINPGNYQLVFGFNKVPTNDLPFRQAVSYALNYELLSVSIGGEDGEIPGVGIMSPPNKGFDSSLPKLQQDIEKAKLILDEAGYIDKNGDGFRELPNGQPMNIIITPQHNQTRQALYLRIAEILVQNLEDIGVKTTLDEESIRNSDYQSNITKEGIYEIYIGYTSPGVAMYDSTFFYMVDQDITNQWGTCHIPDFLEAYQGKRNASNYEEYNLSMLKLQKVAADNTIGLALCWDNAYFPYRTDKYQGWANIPGWGVINGQTWYNLRPAK